MKQTISLVLVAAASLAVACHEPLDTTRTPGPDLTVGEEIFKIACQRIASEEDPMDVSGARSSDVCNGRAGVEGATTPRLQVLAQERARLVAAIDAIITPGTQTDMKALLGKMVPFYEPPNELLPQQTRAAAEVIANLLGDEEALRSLGRIAKRRGYSDPSLRLGMVRPMLSYSNLDQLTTRSLKLIEPDQAGGPAWDTMLRAMALEMATFERSSGDPAGESTLELAKDLLFTENDVWGSGEPRLALIRDRRGFAQVSQAAGGGLVAPFVDRDGDGLADIDAEGNFVGADGVPLDAPTPFAVSGEVDTARRDFEGRALADDGSPMYAYFDADRSLIAGALREGLPLADPVDPALLNLAAGLPLMLGPTIARNEPYGATNLPFDGPDTSEGAAFDLIHGLGVVLDQPVIDDLMSVNETLLREQEGPIARVVNGAFLTDEIADQIDTAALAPDSNTWDDVIRVAEWMAQEPGLLEALIRSFADPRSKRLGQIYAEMMSYRDRVSFNPANPNSPRAEIEYCDPVDRNAPNIHANQSIFQRTLMVIHDLEGVKFCNKEGAKIEVGPVSWPLVGSYRECELFEIDNIAKFYAEAIAGRAVLELKDDGLNELTGLVGGVSTMDQLLETFSGIDGLTTTPTPEALSRLVFGPPNDFFNSLIDDPVTRDGIKLKDKYRDDPIVFAWERRFSFTDGESPAAIGFFEAMKPMVEAFLDNDRQTEGRFLFSSLISALHMHWAREDSDITQGEGPGGNNYSFESNANSYEPIIAAAFATRRRDESCNYSGSGGNLVLGLHHLTQALDEIEVRPSVDGINVMTDAATMFVSPTALPNVTNRAGSNLTSTNDGSRSVRMTPLYVILDALAKIDEAFENDPDPTRLERWRKGRGELIDRFLKARNVSGVWAFENRRSHQILLTALPFIRDRISAHRERGDLGPWARSFADDAAEVVGSPLVASLLSFLDALDEDPEARQAMNDFLFYMMDENSPNDAFDSVLVGTVDSLQLLEDDETFVPLMRAMAPAVATNVTASLDTGRSLELAGGALDASLDLLREMNNIDDTRVVNTVMQNLVRVPDEGGDTPLEVFLDVMAEVNRADVGSTEEFGTEDYRVLMQRTSDLLTGEERGLERVFKIINQRQLDSGAGE